MYSADDGRSVDPEDGYGGDLTLKLPVSTLTISRQGDRYVGVIATPSLPGVLPNNLIFRPTSSARHGLLATPAPLTRIVLHALSPDSFSSVCGVRAGGVWTRFSMMTFHRVGAPACGSGRRPETPRSAGGMGIGARQKRGAGVSLAARPGPRRNRSFRPRRRTGASTPQRTVTLITEVKAGKS